MAGINSGRMGKFGSEKVTASGGKTPTGPKVTYTTPKTNARTSPGKAPQG